jgi:hypothetical protein
MKGTAVAVRVVRAGALAAAALLGAITIAGPTVLAAHPDTSGNNGTVKIHDGAGEPSPEVKNQPHVCTFHLHFFFADPVQAGSWEIQKWSPGAKGAVVLSGTYDTAGDGEDRQPETGAYSLPDGHYKLFWDGDTGKHDKMKVFWVKCAPTAVGGQPAGPTPTPTPPTGGVQPGAATPTPPPAGGVGGIGGVTPPTGGEQGTGSGPTGQVLGAFGASGNTLPATDTLAARATVAASDSWAGLVATIGIVSVLVLLASPRLPREAIHIRRRR